MSNRRERELEEELHWLSNKHRHFTECQLATVSYMATKKRVIKNEFKRQVSIASKMLDEAQNLRATWSWKCPRTKALVKECESGGRSSFQVVLDWANEIRRGFHFPVIEVEDARV